MNVFDSLLKWNSCGAWHIGMLLVTWYLKLREIRSNGLAARKERRELTKHQSWVGGDHLKPPGLHASSTTQGMATLWLRTIEDGCE